MTATKATVEQFMEQIHAEDFEEDQCKLILEQADAYMAEFINVDYDFNPRQQLIYDRIVLETATNFYLNRDGSTKGVSRSYSGLNVLIETLRNPSVGWSD